MNALDAVSVLNPYEKTDECARFYIDDISQTFNFNDIASAGDVYTLSLWLKSEADGAISFGGKTFTSSQSWKRCAATFTATTKNVAISFGAAGTYYVYNAKLEIGNKPTDWTAAPEDVDQSVTDSASTLSQMISEQMASLNITRDEILMQALSEYTQTGDFETFKSATESQLSLLSDQMLIKFAEQQTALEAKNADMQDQLNRVTLYIRADVDGVTIGREESQNAIRADDDEIQIIAQGVEVQRFDATGRARIPMLYVTESAEMLGYIEYMDAAGNVNCAYVGGGS